MTDRPAAHGSDADDVVVRRMRRDELGAVVQLCGDALGWRPDEPNEALFRWKHVDNPAGPSPIWVGVVGGQVVAVRAFLRWTFEQPGGERVRAVRAVDTATHPAHQGRGLFSTLTRGALGPLRDDGTAFVFNTPNEQSRPGYLKLGWREVGRVPVVVALRGPRSVARLATARVPAAKWSLDTPAGAPAEEVLRDDAGLRVLLARRRGPRGIRTRLTPEHLRWRYGTGPVTYRAVTGPGGLASGLAVFRLRSRGDAVEAVLADVLTPAGASRVRAALVAEVLESSGADHLLAVSRVPLSARTVPAPTLGPVLTWRALGWSDRPRRRAWELSLGDVELF